jgi:hypothetical protein
MQLRNAERLVVGDTQIADGREWQVEAAEIQGGKVQVLWKEAGGEDRRWTEHDPHTALRIRPAITRQSVRMIKNARNVSVKDRAFRKGSMWTAVSVAQVPGGVLIEWEYDGALHPHLHDPAEGLYLETTAEVPS